MSCILPEPAGKSALLPSILSGAITIRNTRCCNSFVRSAARRESCSSTNWSAPGAVEEKAIITAAPELAAYVVGLKHRSRKVVTLALGKLLRLVREYPREPLLGAVREAGRYGLYDLDRLERMILRRVTREYFLLEGESGDD